MRKPDQVHGSGVAGVFDSDMIFREVIARATEGEAAALSQLWSAFNPQLVRFLRSINIADAEDVASETWISMARAIRTFEGGEKNFRMLLFHIARRRVTDYLRRQYRDKSIAVEDSELERSSDLSRQGPEGEGEGVEEALKLLQLIPGSQAEVIALRILGDLEVSEVAEIVGRSEGAVRVLSHRGLSKLNEILKGKNAGSSKNSASENGMLPQATAAVSGGDGDE